VDGTGRRQLTNDAAKDRGPRWSPDGQRITFYSDRNGRYDIWSIHPDGGSLERLTDRIWPVWLNDNEHVLFRRQDKLFLVDRSKRVRELLSAAPDQFGLFALSPDNRRLAFTRVVSEADIWLATLK
jgi:Tol biopolymer transport system component